jgi:hypothetical protein
MPVTSSLRFLFVPPLAALAALMAGLVPAVTETGRIDPMDWLIWGGVALLGLILLRRAPPSRWDVAVFWALVTVPIGLLSALAGAGVPWVGIALFGIGLAGVAAIAAFAQHRPTAIKWAALAGCLILLLAMQGGADRLAASDLVRAKRPVVGVVSALPLYGEAIAQSRTRSRGPDGRDAVRSVGLRSPLWQVMERAFDLRPLDAVEEASLRGVDRLLLAHPRQLAPAELVAIDRWVRMGGHVVILADPLLHWPDERSLADPRRAPITSLLDPLLRHWGLTLQAVTPEVVAGPDRLVLESGALLQLAGASHFALAARTGCVLAEQGLIAQCRIGQGEALLMADADWLNDTLWTMAPDRPGDQRAWTSDAVPMLAHLLDGRVLRVAPWHSWISDEKRLRFGLRWAFLALIVIGGFPFVVRRFPIFSHLGKSNDRDQKENIDMVKKDSG